jgi:hypothetical protein
MNKETEKHLNVFKSVADNRELAWYIEGEIMPDDISTLNYIMYDQSHTPSIVKAAQNINELMSEINFKDILNPEMIQVTLLRSSSSFHKIIPNYMSFLDTTQKWRIETGKQPMKIDF